MFRQEQMDFSAIVFPPGASASSGRMRFRLPYSRGSERTICAQAFAYGGLVFNEQDGFRGAL